MFDDTPARLSREADRPAPPDETSPSPPYPGGALFIPRLLRSCQLLHLPRLRDRRRGMHGGGAWKAPRSSSLEDPRCDRRDRVRPRLRPPAACTPRSPRPAARSRRRAEPERPPRPVLELPRTRGGVRPADYDFVAGAFSRSSALSPIRKPRTAGVGLAGPRRGGRRGGGHRGTEAAAGSQGGTPTCPPRSRSSTTWAR